MQAMVEAVPMAIRLRNSMDVGDSWVSASEIVGKARASPPAWVIPLRTPSNSAGMSRWQVV